VRTTQVKVAVILTATLVAGAVARMPAAVSDPVTTDAGKLSGVTLPSGVRAFKGVPFGAPPVGDLRWKEPQPVVKWDGVRKAETFGNVCVQPKQPTRVPNNVTTDLPDSPAISEDCLYLNVWTSAPRAGARQPVMVWIFGGAYAEGGGSSPHNDGEALAKKGVVMVSFNYRLGAFGFFSHPELTKESGHNASGNQALADSIAVLRWVKTNIAAFGGDPNNVTIFGESAGAAMVGGLAGSPVAKGLFHRAISESGAWMGLGMGPMLPRARAEQSAVIVPGGRGRGRGDGPPAGPPPPAPPLPPLAELRARPTDEVVKTLRGAGMIIDGWIVPEDLSITFANGKQNAVDVIAGFNKDEHTSLGGNAAFRGTPILVQPQELDAARGDDYTIAEDIDLAHGSYEVREGEHEPLPGIRVLPTPGHSPGHQSVAIDTDAGRLILAGQVYRSASDFVRALTAYRLTLDGFEDPPPWPAWMPRFLELEPYRVAFGHDLAVWQPDA